MVPALSLLICLIALAWSASPVKAQPLQTIYNTPQPTVVRVAIRAFNNPWGPILWVQTVGFQEYCSDVLPNEWMPDWNPQALEAGALAAKMFAWYNTLHPVTHQGFTYDVDNTTNYQYFKDLSGTPQTDAAVQAVWNMAYVPPSGEILPLDYRSGWHDGPNWVFVGSTFMSQWGSQYLASVGHTFLQILNLYYPNRQLRWVS
ncbi:hypothetical protein D2Q93_08950 [Alicyclobacillaceae bacterium I2511]|nr:hypothetical protein D2Q93_08950 [Alicyclobacillaceae bacterium I2511]